MLRLIVGDRVKVAHGTGIVKGFERFDSKGMSEQPSLIQSESMQERVVIVLDSGHSWSCGHQDYYEYTKAITKL